MNPFTQLIRRTIERATGDAAPARQHVVTCKLQANCAACSRSTVKKAQKPVEIDENRLKSTR